MLQRENLATVAQRGTSQQPQLGKRVEDHARRLEAFHVLQDPLRGVDELELRGVKQGVLLVRLELLVAGRELMDVDAVQRPTMRRRDGLELFFRLRQGHVQHGLARRGAVHQELQRERGFPRPWYARPGTGGCA